MKTDRVILGSHPHPANCNVVTGALTLKSVFIYDASGGRDQLCFQSEPCAPFVYAVAGTYDPTVKENSLTPNATAYTINVFDDTAPFISYQEDFPANSMQDMFLLFLPPNNSNPSGSGYISEPVSYQLVNPPDPSTVELSSIRQAGSTAHRFQVSQPTGTGIVGLAILPDSQIQWIGGRNVGGNTIETGKAVAVTNFSQVGVYGIAIRDDREVTEVVWFYYSDLPYTIFDFSDDGFFFGTQSDGSLDILDITTPDTPTLISHTAGICATGACLKRAGDVVWLGDSATNDLIGVDVSGTPTVISTTALGDTPQGLDVSGDFVYVSLAGGDVKCFDVSTPSAPSLSATESITDFTPYQKHLQCAFYHVYVLGVQTSTGKPTLATLRA